jgi:hypothetical protein
MKSADHAHCNRGSKNLTSPAWPSGEFLVQTSRARSASPLGFPCPELACSMQGTPAYRHWHHHQDSSTVQPATSRSSSSARQQRAGERDESQRPFYCSGAQ